MALTKVRTEVTDLNQANSESGLRMPTGTAFSGTPAEGMMRNDTSQTSQGSESTMQHYNGTDWINYVNYYPCSTSLCNYPTTATLLYQFQDNLNDTCGSYNASVGSGSVTYITGKYGKAVNFNGSSYVTLNSTLPWSSSFTISFWVNPTTLPGGTFHLPFMQQGYSTSSGGAQTGLALYLYGSAIRPYIAVPGNTYELFNTGSLSTGVWQNIVLVRTYSTSWELYLDGTSLGTYTSQGLTDDFSNSIIQYFGANGNNSLYYYDGGIDQVRVFASALSASQVSLLYNERNC